jgi:hypothetical protein
MPTVITIRKVVIQAPLRVGRGAMMPATAKNRNADPSAYVPLPVSQKSPSPMPGVTARNAAMQSAAIAAACAGASDSATRSTR